MIVHEETPPVAQEEQLAPACCHYWVIETANGPISRGECDICHEVRDFKNSVFEMDRDSQDNRSRKGQDVVEDTQPAVDAQSTVEPEHTVGMDDEDVPEEEEAGFAEPGVDEPEFAGVSEA